MAATKSGLEFVLSARGADGVVREIGRVGQGISGATRETHRGAGGWERWRSGIHQSTTAVRGLWNATKKLAALTGIGAGLGFAAIAKDLMDAETSTLALKYQTGLTGVAWENINNSLERMRTTTGYSRTELNKMVDDANDLGLNLQTAADSMEDIAAWSKLMGLSSPGAAMGAVGAISQATGGKMNPRAIMAMLGGAARGTARMPGGEEGFLASVSKNVALMRGMGPEQIQQALQVIAGSGGTFQGKEVFSAMKQLENPDAALRRTLGGNLGANGAETMLRLADAARAGGREFEKLPDNIKMIARALAENADVVADVGRKAAEAGIDLAGFGASIDEVKRSQAVGWAGMIEDMKMKAEPLVRSAFSWILEHKDELANAFGTLLMAIKDLVDFVNGVFSGARNTGEAIGGGLESFVHGTSGFKQAQGAVGARREGEDPLEYAGRIARQMNRQGPDAGNQLDAVQAEAARIAGLPGARDRMTAGGQIGRIVVNVINNLNPETPHTRVDADVDGQRVPAIATVR